MRKVLKIVKSELQDLFFSPIAWFILVVFIIQTSIPFYNILEGVSATVDKYGASRNITASIFNSQRGYFTNVLNVVYLYIPLLTMGLISREVGNGSIKLLYSSPITNSQIVFGKFLSVVAYALVMVGVLAINSIIAIITVDNVDIPLILTGLLGIFLLICTYGSIGLYMSSLTSYQMVVALSTFVVLTFFSLVGTWWQTVPFVRDITYWLSMPGRAGTFVRGLVSTEGLLYFTAVPLFFIYLTIIRLKLKREVRSPRRKFYYYGILFASLAAVAYLSSRPVLKIYWDNARFEPNTLTKSSQEIVNNLEGDLEIGTYTNIYDIYKFVYRAIPRTELRDIEFMSMYTRFKPETKLKYNYYYSESHPNFTNDILKYARKDQTRDEIRDDYAKRFDVSKYRLKTEAEILQKEPTLKDEGFQLVKVAKLENGKKGFIRYFDDMIVVPNEGNISAGLKRLTDMEFPKVAFLQGHNERNGLDAGGDNYYAFISKKSRASLYNQGFDVEDVTLDKPIPDDINILVIADMRSPMTPEEKVNYQKYIDKGGNLLILGEPYRTTYINDIIEQFGVELQNGIVVQPTKGNDVNYIFLRPTEHAPEISYFYNLFYQRKYYTLASNRATSVKQVADKGFNVRPMFVTDTTKVGFNAWHETEQRYFDEIVPTLNEKVGEKSEEAIPMIVALDRKVGDKTQKIVIGGDADIVSSQVLGASYYSFGRNTRNFDFINGTFNWLSDGESPIDMRRPSSIDTTIKTSETAAKVLMYIFMYGFAAAVLAFSIFFMLRRRSK